MKVYKQFLANGSESRTDQFYVDANGKAWPIYVKRLAIPALANAGSIAVAHGVATIKLNGHFKCQSLEVSNAGNTLRCGLHDIRLTSVVLTDATNIGVTNTADLSLYVNGSMVIEYCKTTD
jgi:hypothetical protein